MNMIMIFLRCKSRLFKLLPYFRGDIYPSAQHQLKTNDKAGSYIREDKITQIFYTFTQILSFQC